MNGVLLVAVGGALGAVARYGMGLMAVRLFGAGFPWGTLAVNVIGGFAMGFLFGVHADKRSIVLFATTGLLGGFTTFSAFSLETVRMLESGHGGSAALYVSASVALSCAGVFAGLALARTMR